MLALQVIAKLMVHVRNFEGILVKTKPKSLILKRLEKHKISSSPFKKKIHIWFLIMYLGSCYGWTKASSEDTMVVFVEM